LIYSAADGHALLQATLNSNYNAKGGDFRQLQDLGVQKFSYVVLTAPKMEANIQFPNDVAPLVEHHYQSKFANPTPLSA
jgi:hypothetical protein